MEYVNHKGKTIAVSDKRYNEYLRKPENNDIWISFRMKKFGFSKEDLIMHPSNVVIFSKDMIKGNDGYLHFPKDKDGNFIIDNRAVYFIADGVYEAGYYLMNKLSKFKTPEEAYEYAISLPLRENCIVSPL